MHLTLLLVAFAGFSSSSAQSLLTNKKICISGGGPAGLFLAIQLIQQDPTVQVTILEKARRGRNNVNAFGIGLGARLLKSLETASPALRQQVESVAQPASIGLSIVSRAHLSEQMTRYLEKIDRKRQCTINFGEGCDEIDLEGRRVKTTKGRTIEYDLLIGADGINSIVRRKLVTERGIREEHYLEPSSWKALSLPPQPDFESNSFKPLQHPLLVGGRILPRYPEGHILLMFWNAKAGDNPGNISTAEELKTILTDALQDDPPKNSTRRIYGVLGVAKDTDFVGKKRTLVFDDNAVGAFLKTQPGRSHYMKVDRFHDDSVALVGDAAAGMNSLLGQGCACGFKCAGILADCLLDPTATEINEALQKYTTLAAPEAHSITDLNLVTSLFRAGHIVKVLMILLSLLQKLQGKAIFKRMSEPDISYEQVRKESRLLIALSRFCWKRQREPVSA